MASKNTYGKPPKDSVNIKFVKDAGWVRCRPGHRRSQMKTAKKKVIKRKQPTIGQLHKRLTIVFNRYIRLRDCEGKGEAACISCKVVFPFVELDAGHFVPANCYYLRYNEFNTNAQCRRCNRRLHGNLIHYFVALGDKYQDDIPFQLELLMDEEIKYTRDILVAMIADYKRKVKELEV